MEGSASPLASASAPLASTASTVTKQTVQQPVSMEERVSIWENAFVLRDSKETNVNSVNAISPVEMEENVWVRINASAPKATKETFVQSLSASLAADCMGPVLSPTSATARKAGTGGTAIKGTEPAVRAP